MSDPTARDRAEAIWGKDHAGAAAQLSELSEAAHAAPCGLFGPKKITLRIPGHPQPGGSKRAFTPKGWSRPIITDANPKAADWKRTVQVFAQQAGIELLQKPLCVSANFYLRRPQGHFGRKGLRPSAPMYPSVKPDALKLMRSTEDALTGIAWRDDAQIVAELISKRYSEDGWTGVLIVIEEVQ